MLSALLCKCWSDRTFLVSSEIPEQKITSALNASGSAGKTASAKVGSTRLTRCSLHQEMNFGSIFGSSGFRFSQFDVRWGHKAWVKLLPGIRNILLTTVDWHNFHASALVEKAEPLITTVVRFGPWNANWSGEHMRDKILSKLVNIIDCTALASVSCECCSQHVIARNCL